MPPRTTWRRAGALYLVSALLAQGAFAAQAPYTENFDNYPTGGTPANFVERSDPDWGISNNGTNGTYRGNMFAEGTTKSSSTGISLDNVPGKNFTFRTRFSIASVSDQNNGLGKVVTLSFYFLGGYSLDYRVVAAGTVDTGRIVMYDKQSSAAFFSSTAPFNVMIHGGYADGSLFLTGSIGHDGSAPITIRATVPSPGNGTEFGYRQFAQATAFPPRVAGVDANYDDFSVIFETIPVRLSNLSTRVNVRNGEEVAIAGFIVTGASPRRIAVRGVAQVNQFDGFNPFLQLVRPDGTEVAFNDNWKDTQQHEIEIAGLYPTYDSDAVLIATLEPGAYTAIFRDKNNGAGRGLVELYDLTTGWSGLGNISTRGRVGLGDDALIGGVILTGDDKARVLVRALGPSLGNWGVNQPLGDPTLELHDEHGALVLANDNWRDTQQAAIEATGLAPSNPAEAALIADLFPTNYTAIVRGKNDTTGVGLVEIYHLK